MSKLLIVKGMSGVGKSTVANILHGGLDADTVLLPKDVFSIDMINDNSRLQSSAKDCLKYAIERFLKEDTVVIVEGPMLSSHWFESFDKIIDDTKVNAYQYFLKTDPDEAVRRSRLRPKASIVTEDVVRRMNKEIIESARGVDVQIDVTNMTAFSVAEIIAKDVGIELKEDLEKSKINSGSFAAF